MPHFDANENFTIQLVGSKKWKYAKNKYILNPTSNYFSSDPINEDMRSYVHHSLASEMPSEHKTVHLRPGSIFYLPAGVWHATHATAQESISLNIVFPRITRADVFLRFLKPMLLDDFRWRERADDLLGNMGKNPVARFHMPIN